ncbi:MAG: RIP metalloprotease RseP, partial [Candidatus Omnitrophica bacterium]|nr:RIP metalloprotease RseP [Candidatus Omnitrophota bacterium]
MLESLLANIQSTGVFIIVLGVLIVVHEWGHFITAKKLGITVEQFSLGFGPTLFSRHYNGTQYLIKAIPLGGYVKMAGDERTNCTGDPKEFFSQSIGKRSLVVFNGPLVNYILAYVCFVFVFMLGFPDLSTNIGTLMEGYPAQEAGLLTGDKILTVDKTPVESWGDIQSSIAGS